MNGDERRRAFARQLASSGGREVRSMSAAGVELRSTGSTLTVTGWASVTETPYDLGAFVETIKRGAFAKTLAANPDVQLLVNHAGSLSPAPCRARCG